MYRAHPEKRHEPIQSKTTLDQLVPQDHLVRRLDRHIDFSIVHRLCAPLYSNTGTPGIDPEIIIKIILLGPLFNIRSVRQTVREVQTNLAYRWFLGLGIDEKVPDHSTISQAYRRRFQGNDVFQKIFEDIVRQAESHGLVSGRILITDSTHIRANASKKKFDKVEVERGVFGVIARRRFGGKKGMFRKTRYTYLPEEDAYLCPARQRLIYQTTDRHGYHHYVSDPSICQNCPLLEKCTSSRTHRRDITRHVDEHYREQVNENRLSASGKSLYRLRPQTVERSFADGKELHGLRFTFYRGTAKVQRANLVAATAQNIKKLANLLARKDRLHSISSIFCQAERLDLVGHKKRRTKSHVAIWFVNSLRVYGLKPYILFFFKLNL